MQRFATQTSVSVDKSLAEIQSTLRRYGADKFMYGEEQGRSIICFQAGGKTVKFILPLPSRSDPKFGKTLQGRTRSPALTEEAWEQACRSAWRSLVLSIKAKLETVASGISTFETEFLSHFVLPGGQTIAEKLIPQLETAMLNGKMPQLMIGGG